MSISQQEFEAILADDTKQVFGNIVWDNDVDNSPAKEFRIEVHYVQNYSLFIAGRWNPLSGKLSYSFILRGTGRIYGLDLGVGHRNPDGEVLEDRHKNSWWQGSGTKWAYVPKDITATWDRPLEVWEQFCAEASLRHHGIMFPPVVQEELAP